MSRPSGPESDPAALDRALARFAAAEAGQPFPSAEAIRLEALLALERRRLARAAAVRVGVHALAFAVCVGLLAVAWFFEIRTGNLASAIASASCGGALVAVAMSMWNLIRVVDDATFVS